MNKIQIKRIVFIVCAAVLGCAAVAYNNYVKVINVRGNFALENTRNNIKNLAKIKMITPDSGEVNIYNKDGIWYFAEAKNYFANTNMLASFYNLVGNARIISVHKGDKKIFTENMLDDNAVKLITYDQKGKVLDEIWLGKRTADGESAVIRRKNGKYFYTINEVTDFSGEAQDWVPYPLLNIEPDIIKKITVNGTEFSAEKLQKILPYSKKWLSLFNTLRFIDYQGIEYKKALDNVKVSKAQEIGVAVIGGLVYKLAAYDVGDSCWMAVTLANERIAHKDVVPFVKNNQMYFADWIFQLNEEQGQALCNTDYITGESAVMKKL